MIKEYSLLSIDPGQSTGIVYGTYTDEREFEPRLIQQITGGIEGFSNWYDESGWADIPRGVVLHRHDKYTVISERFQPRPIGARTYKSAELEPLRIEGFMMAEGIMPFDYKDRRWRSPQLQVLRKGETSAQSKKLSDDLLRAGGLWSTGKDVGQPDANDANSAMKHALSYLREMKHIPTIEKYWSRLESGSAYGHTQRGA